MPSCKEDFDKIDKTLNNKVYMKKYFKEHPTKLMLLESIDKRLSNIERRLK